MNLNDWGILVGIIVGVITIISAVISVIVFIGRKYAKSISHPIFETIKDIRDELRSNNKHNQEQNAEQRRNNDLLERRITQIENKLEQQNIKITDHSTRLFYLEKMSGIENGSLKNKIDD